MSDFPFHWCHLYLSSEVNEAPFISRISFKLSYLWRIQPQTGVLVSDTQSEKAVAS